MLVAEKPIIASPITRPAPQRAPKRQARKKAVPLVSPKLLALCMSMVLVLALAIVYRYACVAQITFAIDQAQQDRARLLNDNQMLKVSIAKATSLDEVENRARAMGFRPPESNQYVSLAQPAPTQSSAASKVAVH